MHPHPASVHFPIAYIILSNSLKLGNAWRPQLFSTLSPDLNIPKAAFYLQPIGLLAAVPAALTGVWEFVKLGRRQGYYKRDTGKLSEKARVSLIHAGFSVMAIIGAFATWIVSGLGQREGFWLKAVDTISTGFLLYGAKLGGMLAFQYGIGFAVNKQK